MGDVRFYYCKQCNKGVETKYTKCDSCRRLLNKGNVRVYTEAELEELMNQAEFGAPENDEQQNRMNSMAEAAAEVEMVCPRCGRRYDITHSVCDCGTVLELYYEAVEITEEQRDSANGELYGEVLEEPEWKLIVRRFVNGVPQEGNREIVLNRNITSMGRAFVAKNHFFTYDTLADSGTMNKVSKYNAVFIAEDGKLFIQYDKMEHRDCPAGKERAPIFLDGEMLQKDRRYRLTDGDSILMGTNAPYNVERCLEFIVKRTQENNVVSGASIASLKEMINELGEKMDYSEEMQRKILDYSMEIKEIIEGIKKLQIDSFTSVDAYMKSVQEFELNFQKSGKAKSRKEYVDIFLKHCAHKEEFLSCLNEVQRDYLESAALVDTVFSESGVEDLDYSGAFIYLGKLLENFLKNTVADLLEKYNKEEWEKQKIERFTGREKKTLYIGDYTMAIARARDNGGKMFQDIAEELAERNSLLRVDKAEVARQFLMIDEIRQIRNDSAHSSMELVLSNKVVRVDEVSYRKAIDLIIKDSFILEIAKYHKNLFGV